MRKAVDQPGGDGVAHADEGDDGNAGLFRGNRSRIAPGQDYVDLRCGQFLSVLPQPVRPASRTAALEGDLPAKHIATSRQGADQVDPVLAGVTERPAQAEGADAVSPGSVDRRHPKPDGSRHPEVADDLAP